MNIFVSILIAAVPNLITLVGVVYSNSKHNASITSMVEYRLSELEKKQDIHNQVIDRVYKLEKVVEVIEERQSTANHRIDDLEEFEKRL